ncbi:hypothetical protein SAMN05421866_4180 [Chryseobacterium oranimense]|uniref:Uncharacterized protein n=1 Tax=Chryseobacterium oranimense TaxID=421058 RepID=A0A1M5WQ26_9FLAO|nr:hypothetical protein [Chryseobacterium oranimense]SHH89696.1 hypothetical protein SAMN05421866_4180 [Chryseobacterium oranimense]
MKNQTNILKPRKIKGEVFRKILDDYNLRKKIADETGNRETAVSNWAYRESDKVLNYFAVKAIKKHTGWTDKQIFQSQ